MTAVCTQVALEQLWVQVEQNRSPHRCRSWHCYHAEADGAKTMILAGQSDHKLHRHAMQGKHTLILTAAQVQVALKQIWVQAEQELPTLQHCAHAMMLRLMNPKASVATGQTYHKLHKLRQHAAQSESADSSVHAGGAEAVLGGGRAQQEPPLLQDLALLLC